MTRLVGLTDEERARIREEWPPLPPPGSSVEEWAAHAERLYEWYSERIAPFVRAMVAGERDVPVQPPGAEAWITLAVYLEDSPHSLKQLIGNADYMNHAIPNAEEVAWAFLQLRKRDWLVEEGGLVDLSRDSRRIIATVVGGQGSVMDWDDRLHAWLLAHPVD